MTITRFVLRRGTAADAPALWTVRADAIRGTCCSHYPRELIERWAASPLPEAFAGTIERKHVVVGIAESRIAGFAILDAFAAKVEAVFVVPAVTRRGLGRHLLAHLEATAREAGLHRLDVDASLNAVPFYAAAGYETLSQGVHTTSTGIEIACVRMEKSLDRARTC